MGENNGYAAPSVGLLIDTSKGGGVVRGEIGRLHPCKKMDRIRSKEIHKRKTLPAFFIIAPLYSIVERAA
jgi:hypothetical protein